MNVPFAFHSHTNSFRSISPFSSHVYTPGSWHIYISLTHPLAAANDANHIEMAKLREIEKVRESRKKMLSIKKTSKLKIKIEAHSSLPRHIHISYMLESKKLLMLWYLPNGNNRLLCNPFRFKSIFCHVHICWGCNRVHSTRTTAHLQTNKTNFALFVLLRFTPALWIYVLEIAQQTGAISNGKSIHVHQVWLPDCTAYLRALSRINQN